MGMIKKYGIYHAEISCLAVRPAYRREGRGDTLLAYLERRALFLGVEYTFVLSTRTMQVCVWYCIMYDIVFDACYIFIYIMCI